MKGWLLYHQTDASKNIAYIQMFLEQAAHYEIELSTVFVEQLSSDQHFDHDDPDFIINRSRDAQLAAHFEQQGIRIFNPACVTRICNDKAQTHMLAVSHEIPVMNTVFTYDTDIPMKTLPDFPFVMKPVSGHGGDWVTLIHNNDEMKSTFAQVKKQYSPDEGIIFQQCASEIGKDLRVYVLDGHILAPILRTSLNTSLDIRSNFSLGNKAILHKLTIEETTLIQKIIPLLPFDCVGIDLIYHNGHPVLNEIEDAVGARMLYANSDIDIVYEYMKYIAHCMNQR